MARGSYLRSLISNRRDVPVLRPLRVPIWGRQPGVEFGSEVVNREVQQDYATPDVSSGLPSNPSPRTPVVAPRMSAEVALTGIRGPAPKAIMVPTVDTAVSPAASATAVETQRTEPALPAWARESDGPLLSRPASRKAFVPLNPEAPSKEMQLTSAHGRSIRRPSSYLQDVVSSSAQNQESAATQADETGLLPRAVVTSSSSQPPQVAFPGNSLNLPPIITPLPPVQVHQMVSGNQVEQKQLGNSVRIGSIDIHISPPPAPVVKPPARPRAPIAAAAMSRGFTSSFGLNQG